MRASRSLLLAVVATIALTVPFSAQAEDPPQTGFEQNGGTAWTTHEEELAFLTAVDSMSDRVAIEVIGTTDEARPIHLVRVGDPAPRTAAAAAGVPVELHVCSQHGNEPAGREGCLQYLRDLAFTTDETLVQQLRDTVLLFVPTANPDGRANNSRTNTAGTDINRDHLNLVSPEAQAIAQVVRDWSPEIVVDHHEYGPGQPLVYDDEVLYLWPRNLNVDEEIHDIGVEFSKDHLNPCLTDEGYTSDEYGLSAVGPIDVTQTAGDGDEGIARNAMGLRHSVGILVESAVSPNPAKPTEVIAAENMKRRVASQVSTITCTLSYVREHGTRLVAAQAGSITRKIAEGRAQSAPVYFQGQDEDTTVAGDAPETIADDTPPCAYDLTGEQLDEVGETFLLHAITTQPRGTGVRVTMAQAAEPLIPLLLDPQNEDRKAVDGTPVDDCGGSGAPPPDPQPSPQPRPVPPPAPVPTPPLPATGAPAWLAAAAAASLATAVGLRRLRRR
jgi:hypothetical protein